YRPFDPKSPQREARWGAARVAANVIAKDREPVWIDLGEETAIERRVEALRAVLSDPRSDVHAAARALDAAVMAPVRDKLSGARWLFVAPDGALDLVPFAA